MDRLCLFGSCLTLAIAGAVASANDDLGQLFDVAAWTEQSLEIPDQAGAPFQVTIRIEGEDHTFALAPWSFRSADTMAYEIGADGIKRPFAVAAPKTYRGFAIDDPSMIAAGSLLDGGLTLLVLEKGETQESDTYWSVQPISDAIPEVPRTEHIVFSAEDSTAEGVCGGELENPFEDDGGPSLETASNAIEIAFDADYQFYQKNGNDTQATIDDVDRVMAGVITVYERDVDATFTPTEYIVRTSSGANPYTTNDSGTLLEQFRSQWLNNHQSVHRDLAHLFTGRNIDGSVIGIAWLNAVCSSNGFGLSESRFTLGLSSRVALTAHEIGHNCSASHCSGSSCHIMCAGLGGCGGVGTPNFGTTSINSIKPYIASRSCVDAPPPTMIQIPFVDNFDTGSFDTVVWPDNNGVSHVNAGANAVSSPNAIRFPSGASLATLGIDFDFTSLGYFPHIQFWTMTTGASAGDQFILEYSFNNGSSWSPIATLTSDGENETVFSYRKIQVPTIAMIPGNRLRMRTSGGTWNIDNFRIGTIEQHGLPWGDAVDLPLVDTTLWSEFASVGVETATNPPSGTRAIKLDGSDVLTSKPLAGFYIDNRGDSWLSAYVQHRGAPNGERLIAEYKPTIGDWTEVWSVTSDGSVQSSFDLHQGQIPFLGWYDGMQVRFRVDGSGTGNDWFIDDVALGHEIVVDTCAPDLTGEGDVNTNDFFLFLSLYQSQDPRADFAPGGGINTNDFFAFLAAYQAGC